MRYTIIQKQKQQADSYGIFARTNRIRKESHLRAFACLACVLAADFLQAMKKIVN